MFETVPYLKRKSDEQAPACEVLQKVGKEIASAA